MSREAGGTELVEAESGDNLVFCATPLRFICIYAPEGCPHGTHTSGTAYTRFIFCNPAERMHSATLQTHRLARSGQPDVCTKSYAASVTAAVWCVPFFGAVGFQ